MKLTGPLLMATIVGALGGLLFGVDTAVIQRCTEIPLLLAKYGSDAGIAGVTALCRS